MTYYVYRVGRSEEDTRVGWVGPIRSHAQALRERAAWEATGEWVAGVFPSSKSVRRSVRDWQRAADIRHGRRPRY